MPLMGLLLVLAVFALVWCNLDFDERFSIFRRTFLIWAKRDNILKKVEDIQRDMNIHISKKTHLLVLRYYLLFLNFIILSKLSFILFQITVYGYSYPTVDLTFFLIQIIYVLWLLFLNAVISLLPLCDEFILETSQSPYIWFKRMELCLLDVYIIFWLKAPSAI